MSEGKGGGESAGGRVRVVSEGEGSGGWGREGGG